MRLQVGRGDGVCILLLETDEPYLEKSPVLPWALNTCVILRHLCAAPPICNPKRLYLLVTAKAYPSPARRAPSMLRSPAFEGARSASSRRIMTVDSGHGVQSQRHLPRWHWRPAREAPPPAHGQSSGFNTMKTPVLDLSVGSI